MLKRMTGDEKPLPPGDRTVDATSMRPAPELPDGPGHPDEQIGPYRLLSVLGEGGFGTVWLAERRDPFVQRVALKVIKAGMDSRAVIGRFHQERQAMAAMSHPGIARVLDGGLTSHGRPFFVMEFVKGQPITDFCDARRLGVPDRLRLFQRVCEALQHAHLKGVIHRDLKPNNILAFDVEGQAPGVKVIDFGVAKAAHSGVAPHTVFTEIGQMIGTLEYMSPEQADSRVAEIDTRSDIYSLGAVLYELLTGLTPFDADELRGKGLAELQRILVQDDPASPSLRISTIATRDTNQAARIAQQRGEAPFELIRRLRSELEWIPLMAMRKEPQNRYQSAAELARDIERYLHHEPLMAGPPSARYRLTKFIRRRKAVAAGIVAVTLSLTLGLGLALWQWREAIAARGLAETRARESEAVTKFVTEALVSADPMSGGDRDFSVRQAMRQALDRIQRGQLRDQPEVEAALDMTIGSVLARNGDLDGAITPLERAMHTLETMHGADHPDIAKCLNNLAIVALDQNRLKDAESLHQRALGIRERTLGPDDPAIATSLNNLSNLLRRQGRLEDAEPLQLRALAIYERALGPNHPNVAVCLNNVGMMRERQGRIEEAAIALERALEIRESALGPDHPVTAQSVDNLAGLRVTQGRVDEGERLYRRALDIAERTLGPDALGTAGPLNNLAETLDARRNWREAEPLYRRSLAIHEAKLGLDHVEVARRLFNLAANLKDQGRPSEAEPLARRAVEILERSEGIMPQEMESARTLLRALADAPASAP
jgi:serine/threonine protein kinase/Tfp pilus assembly protein PilF